MLRFPMTSTAVNFVYQYSYWLAILVILVASLYQISISHSARFASYFQGRGTVLIVFAHPDDEVMFFLPAILALKARGHNIITACLSTGNADGIGSLRAVEFRRVMAQLRLSKFYIMDSIQLPDGFHAWNSDSVRTEIEKVLVDNPDVDTIMTFDKGGVSGHPNHVSVRAGVGAVLLGRESTDAPRRRTSPRLAKSQSSAFKNLTVLELVTVPLWLKYAVPPMDLLFQSSEDLAVTNWSLDASRLMRLYESQNVWFRQLFSLFSRYAYVNTFKVIIAGDHTR